MAIAPRRRGCTTKGYIIAATAVAIVFTSIAIAITVSVILSPPEIIFSVTGAHASLSKGQLNLTLSVNDTSGRAGVLYRSIIVYMQYADAATGTEYSVSAGTAGTQPHHQLPATTAIMNVYANFLGSPFARAGVGGSTPNISVLVLAVVRSNVGRAYSRPYHVRVVCAPVDYFSAKDLSFPVTCDARHARI